MATDPDVAYLLDLERIKQLKAHYFRFLDEQRWAEWGDLFTEDAVMELCRHGEDVLVITGREAIVAHVSGRLEGVVSVHHGHTPAIEIRGPDEAEGSWAMFDYLEEPVVQGKRVRINGYGYYLEQYRREGPRWRIARLRLTRIRIDRYEEIVAPRPE